MCSAVSFICSCGTEFAEYKEMHQHSTTHEPGQQVLDHLTIKKRRIEKHMEEQLQLHRLQTTEVLWNSPNMDNRARNRFVNKPQIPIQIKQMSQVPQLNSAGSKYSLPNHASPADVKNIFSGVGAPTVDLWMIYQPVVLLKKERSHKQMPYICGKCGQGFVTKTSLVAHHSSHATDKVSGCIGCGLLLSSKKLVPRFHFCNAPPNVSKAKLITARPPGLISKNKVQSPAPRVDRPQAIAPIRIKKPNVIAASKVQQAPRPRTSLQQKIESIRANYPSRNALLLPYQLARSHNPRASFPRVSGSLPPKGRIWNPSDRKSTSPLPAHPYHQGGGGGLTMNSTRGALSPSSSSGGFTCRVCHIPFDSAQVLQRHKCVKAQEFMAQHLQRKHLNLTRVAPVARPSPAQINGNQKLTALTSSAFRGQATAPVNGKTGVEIDTDCYIVETAPDKPTEMIYQVTSSVPIKT